VFILFRGRKFVGEKNGDVERSREVGYVDEMVLIGSGRRWRSGRNELMSRWRRGSSRSAV
jgi:hypothetical protein